jgi:hypothetical protein
MAESRLDDPEIFRTITFVVLGLTALPEERQAFSKGATRRQERRVVWVEQADRHTNTSISTLRIITAVEIEIKASSSDCAIDLQHIIVSNISALLPIQIPLIAKLDTLQEYLLIEFNIVALIPVPKKRVYAPP